MKKRMLAICTGCIMMLLGLTACGGEEVPTQEADYSMVFENQTGMDVSKLEIRPSEDADWSEITLSDGAWKNSYEMPVTLQGQLPIAENGWQVQMTFADGAASDIWEGVHFDDGVTFTFTLEEGEGTAVIPAVAAEEAEYQETEATESDDSTEAVKEVE